jgi:glutamine---fructose-6-phosphate transaminase (isomerizing)
MSGTFLASEIAEQPTVLANLLVAERDRAHEVAAAIRARRDEIAFVQIAARGTSDNAARYAQYLFGAVNRLPVALATPSLFTLYDTPPDLRRALTIGVSQSGASPDIVSVVAAARAQGALTLAITNQPDSPLGQSAEFVLPIRAGTERSVAATKTYSAQLLALAMLSAALTGEAAVWDDLAGVPAWVAATLDLATDIPQRAERYRYLDRLITSGRGYCYGTAFELALKLKETSYLLAEPYSPADFLHGPVAIIDAGFPALLVAPSGATFDDQLAFANTLRDLGAELIVISDRDDALALALELARVKGFDPDRPRGLSKVTLTR